MKSNFRIKNPKLHLLYVKWAVTHLTEIVNCITRLNNFSNINLIDCISALQIERDKLICENAAYADAWEILQSIYNPTQQSN